jgi:hypothetical protein
MGKSTMLLVLSATLIASTLCGSRSDAAPAKQPSCEPANIEVALAKTRALHSAMWLEATHGPAFFKAQAARLYDLILACETLEQRMNLNDTQITKYGAISILGYCDIALSMTAARSYHLVAIL